MQSVHLHHRPSPSLGSHYMGTFIAYSLCQYIALASNAKRMRGGGPCRRRSKDGRGSGSWTNSHSRRICRSVPLVNSSQDKKMHSGACDALKSSEQAEQCKREMKDPLIYSDEGGPASSSQRIQILPAAPGRRCYPRLQYASNMTCTAYLVCVVPYWDGSRINGLSASSS